MKQRIKRMITAAALPAAVLGLVVAGPSASATTALAPLPCHASMSNSHPKDYTTTNVLVRTASYAKVKTVAHYRTTNTPHSGKANRRGRASIPYHISRATPGYKVKVSVHVTKGNRTGNCSTSFTPHR